MVPINRTAILLQPKQPFINWLNRFEKSDYVYSMLLTNSFAILEFSMRMMLSCALP